MALTQVTGPYPIFTDLDGTPLDDGYLYIGEVNDDPETNPIQVYWDANLTIPASQPIRTSNGYAYRNGTPALLYTAGAFSITIRNKREEFVLYSPVGYGFDPAAVSASVVKNDFIGDGVEVDFVLSASPSTKLATSVFINGVYQEKDSYNTLLNVLTFGIAPPLNSSIEVMTNETGVINSGNATAISYTASFAGATAQTVQTKLEQYVSVKDFGAVGDGVTDDTAAIQAAIDSQAGFLSVYFPAGVYKVTSQITISDDRVMLYGDGVATRILFNPTANAVCFLFDKGSTRSVQNVIRDLAFYSTDTTYTKTAIKLVDVTQTTIENVQSIFPHWYGNGSVFLHILGRDSTKINKLNCFADKPILISPIPAPHIPDGIGIDHFHFSDIYLGNTVSANPLITIEDGVFVSDVTFDGYQAWVGGSHGLYWSDTTTSIISHSLTIDNVRWEQPSALGGWTVYISRTGAANALQSLNIKNMYCAPECNGVYMRKCDYFVLGNVIYPGVLTALDLDNTNTFGELNFVANQNTATITANATRLSGKYISGGNVTDLLPSTVAGAGLRQIWNPSKTLGFSQLEPKTFTIPASSTVTFSDNSLKGLVFIYADNAGVSAVMAVNGTNNTTKVLTQSDAGQFGTSVGALNYNLYWDAGSSLYKLQVNVAFPITFYVVTMGKGER